MRVILVTGMSGSGKSIALHVLEDAGYAVVDNLPARFLVDVVGDLAERGVKRAAVSIDIRAGIEAVHELPSLLPHAACARPQRRPAAVHHVRQRHAGPTLFGNAAVGIRCRASSG